MVRGGGAQRGADGAPVRRPAGRARTEGGRGRVRRLGGRRGGPRGDPARRRGGRGVARGRAPPGGDAASLRGAAPARDRSASLDPGGDGEEPTAARARRAAPTPRRAAGRQRGGMAGVAGSHRGMAACAARDRHDRGRGRRGDGNQSRRCGGGADDRGCCLARHVGWLPAFDAARRWIPDRPPFGGDRAGGTIGAGAARPRAGSERCIAHAGRGPARSGSTRAGRRGGRRPGRGGALRPRRRAGRRRVRSSVPGR